jgi:hypothetical protein
MALAEMTSLSINHKINTHQTPSSTLKSVLGSDPPKKYFALIGTKYSVLKSLE